MFLFQGKGKKKRNEKNSKGREGGMGWLSVDDLQSWSSPSLMGSPVLQSFPEERPFSSMKTKGMTVVALFPSSNSPERKA